MAERAKGRLLPLPLKNRLALTAGEGIGFEIAAKALSSLRPQRHIQLLAFTSKRWRALKCPHFQTRRFESAEEALKAPFSESVLLEVPSSRGPGQWVEEAARLCLSRRLSGLVTGPLSKKAFQGQGLSGAPIGHTGLLKKMSQTQDAFMLFSGSRFHVALLTDHIPFRKIQIQKAKLRKLIFMALRFRDLVLKDPRPIGVLGLNPHAGEGGLLGSEEERILKPLLMEFSSAEAKGPLSPDSAFVGKSPYSLFIALYHDQGLIPFKAAHGFKGAALTLGLPFIRTSVAHGTAPHLRPGEARPDSLILALRLAFRLVRGSQKKGALRPRV